MGTIFVCQLIACAIVIAAFACYVTHLLKKRATLYQQIILWSIGCFGLYSIASVFVRLVYPTPEFEANISFLSRAGCICALYSANYGTMDKIVTEAPEKRSELPARLVSMAFTLAVLGVFLLWRGRQLFSAVVFAVTLLPMIPASYYHAKHLFLPMDELGLLRRNRGVNILSLALYVSFVAHAVLLCLCGPLCAGLCDILSAGLVAGIAVSAKKGIVRR